jgi:uncharacterized protein YbjT (DUF2867 family)
MTPLPSPRSALVLGASGLVGARVVEHLLADERAGDVTCLVRRAGDRSHPRLTERVVDFDKLEGVPVATDVLCAIGTTMKKAGSREAFRRVDYEIPLRVAQLARDAGATRFVLVSSVGASANAGSFYLKTKGELERALGGLGFDELVVLRPSFLAGDRADSRPAEAVGIAFAKAVGGLMVGGLRKYRAISADVVARAMVAACAAPPSPDAPRVRVLEHDAIVELARRVG